ncbi:extracellular solute-binding protein [Mesorhizobium sp.]|uniref:extracellular solute-binding protein n=1 Tax=Mesorhizobium sp. TaxID=1871066 RepID=UPI0012232D34|nr:extracellular solute-binding protein [Mesorhizobium sp.]TIO09629.1 MAG: extracellular solute-binding protein [Mesorhizobium sp.]TIO34119.1 MAG: extracellular solute-binding protein [Mesorhizobium sp.]
MGSTLRRLAIAAACTIGAGAALALAEGGGDLVVFDWSGYEDPLLHPTYAVKYGAEPTFAFFGDEDEAFQKMRAGFKADIAHPCSQSVVKWREAGMLQPLDTSRIAGWKDLNPGIMAMKDLATTADGKAWFMPFDWGNTSLLYRTDNVTPEQAQSLRVFADPKFKGRVTIGDNVDDAYALASLVIDLKDWTRMTDAQFTEASDFLRQVHKNIRLYWTDSTDIDQAFSGNEVDLAWGWNETFVTLKGQGVPIAMNRNTKEGLSTWVCGYVLMKDAPGNLDQAYDFLNAVNAPDVSGYMVTTFGYGHGNGAGMAAIDPKLLVERGFDDLDKFLDKTLFQQPVAPELKQRMIEEFEKIKAGY